MPRQRDDDLLIALGARLQRLRTDRGLTQEQLAEEMDIEAVSLSRMETGARGLSLSTLVRAADALQVSLGDFFEIGRAVPEPAADAGDLEILRLWRKLAARDRRAVIRLMKELAA